MKKVRNYKIQIFWSLVIALFLLLHTGFVLLILDPKVNVVLSVIFGSVYRKAGETVMTTEGGKPETLAIYKAHGKPFLIVGPCAFHRYCEKYGTKDDWEDFFFVRPDSVIRTNVNQGGDIWFRLPGLLIIDDDLTSSDCVRTPSWDDLEHQGASVRYDEATASYVYSLRINRPEQSVSFAIPARLFTSDLLNAPNDTRY
jgi:hypothetical protein